VAAEAEEEVAAEEEAEVVEDLVEAVEEVVLAGEVAEAVVDSEAVDFLLPLVVEELSVVAEEALGPVNQSTILQVVGAIFRAQVADSQAEMAQA